MKKFYLCSFILVCILCICASCSENDSLYNDMPAPIRSFIAKYYPNTAVESYDHTASNYVVRLKNSGGITFNSAYEWESVNGYGERLSQVFLYDQLPPALYSYIQETERLDDVMFVERSPRMYTLGMVDNLITYNVETDAISERSYP